MKPEMWRRVEELYHAALQLEPAARSSYVREACTGDEDLRREVESLLAYDDHAAGFMKIPALQIEARRMAGDEPADASSHREPLLPIPSQIGPYELIDSIGKGGMGEVYLALDRRLGRKVAIKLLPDLGNGCDERSGRFEQEARAASSLNHPNILTVYETGRIERGRFLVTEYVDGETLRQRMTREPRGPIPVGEAIEIAAQIAGALEAAHAAGIIHRDIKPENVMIRRDGLVKILDFGIAKINPMLLSPGMPESQQVITRTGAVLGTVTYMSPEQARGLPVDHRTDIFSLGVVLYEMLAQQRPFGGETPGDSIVSLLTCDPVPLARSAPDIPPALARIVSRCLQKEPDQRFQSTGDLGFALRTFSLSSGPYAGEPLPLMRDAASPVAPSRSPRMGFVRRHRQELVLTVSLTAVIATIAFLMSVRPPPPPARLSTDSSFQPPDGWSLPWSEMPAVSSDGKYIVFSALPASPDVGHEVALFLLDLGSDEMRRLTGSEGGVSPFWSQDSRSVAFWAKGLLQKIDVPDGPVVPVCRIGQCFNGTWNRDGTMVVATLASLGSRLAHVTVATGDVVLLNPFSEDEIGQYDPRFLPDGRHFLYYSENSETADDGIYVASLDAGTLRRRVAVGVGTATYVSPGYLLFGRENVLLAQKFDLQSLRIAGEPMKIAQNVAGFAPGRRSASAAPFSASDNGVLVWRMSSGAPVGTELTWYDRSGRRLGTIGANADYSGPALSRDEKKVAVARMDHTANARDLWVYEIAGGAGLRLTSDPADDFNPVWSVDGQRIIFTSARNGARNIYSIPADGTGALAPLFESGGDKHVEDLSPDGRFLIFNSYPVARRGLAIPAGKAPDLSLLRLSGGMNPTTFLATPNREDQAQFSPNGRWVAFCSDETGQREGFVIGIDPQTGSPGKKYRISVNGASQPRWRGDGREMFFLEGSTLMRIDVDAFTAEFTSGTPTPLFSVNVDKEERRNRFLATRDGQRFLVVTRTQVTGDSTIGVQLNWIAALSR